MMTAILKRNAMNRLDVLLSNMVKNEPLPSATSITQETTKQSLAELAFSEHNPYSSSTLPSDIVTTVPLPPRRNSSSLKHHHRRHRLIEPSDKQKQYQPLLNSSTLDDLFRALTLECEQYLAATTALQNQISNQTNCQTSSKLKASIESNDEDYENLQPLKCSQPFKTSISPLKTSIEVISPVKRHVVSVTIKSKVSTAPNIVLSVKPSYNTTATTTMMATAMATTATMTVPPQAHCHSSDDDTVNISSSNVNRKRRRRARKQIVSSNIIRSNSSSSSNERKKPITDKKSIISKRSCSTDPRHQRNDNLYDNDFITGSSSQKQRTRRPHRRDVSLQHSTPRSERYHENHASPLSILLTSTKVTSDFVDHSQSKQSRRSRLETINHNPLALFDRMHQQTYRPPIIRNNNNKINNNKSAIPTHRIPSYPVY